MSKETFEFQAETKQLLNLMIHSIYTNHEIFLRELISNASDAIDKLHFESLTNSDLLAGESDFSIYLIPDEKSHTLSISDNGIGMNKEELINNIGTIAKSGTKAFLEKMLQAKTDNSPVSGKELIGQFGVGFYSAFMVANKITILTKKAGEKTAYKWESAGDGSYSIEECEKDTRGTTIVLTLDDTFYGDKAEENFLDKNLLSHLVKKYSDYVRYPIKMNFTIQETPKDADGKEIADAPKVEKTEVRTLNTMQPLWTRNKSDIKTEEYEEFYKNLFHDYEAPMKVMHNKVEGTIEYTSLLFFPAHAPYNLYHSDYEPGLQLYSRHVFIMDKCKDLLPEYLRFVKGLVDSPDFSLNISRELLQQSRELKTIGRNLEKSILKMLERTMKNDRPAYEKFWAEYGKSLKIGVYNNIYGDKAVTEKLQELLLFATSFEDKGLVSLKEYVERMPATQKVIYYATGKDRDAINNLPQMELIRDKGLGVLYLLDNVDEFAIESLREYNGKKFQSISRGDLQLDDVESEEVKKETADITKENESLIKDMKEVLKGKVSDIKVSNRLKSSAVCLVADEHGPSFAMEQVFAEANNPMFKAQRILELNPHHALFARLQQLHDLGKDEPQFQDYCSLLYDQALLIEGIMPDNPAHMAKLIASLMAK